MLYVDISDIFKLHIRNVHKWQLQGCYGTSRVVLKAHYSVHLPDQLDRHGCLLQCFVQERRHKEIKRWANQLQTGSEGVERSLLREVTLSHLHDLMSYGTHCLEKWEPQAPEDVARAFQHHFVLYMLEGALEVSLWASRTKRGDIVMVGASSVSEEMVGEVWFHLRYQDTELTMVAKYDPTSTKNSFKASKDTFFVPTSAIRGACIYKTNGPGQIVIAPETFWPKA